jgi:hypothetical protein
MAEVADELSQLLVLERAGGARPEVINHLSTLMLSKLTSNECLKGIAHLVTGHDQDSVHSASFATAPTLG